MDIMIYDMNNETWIFDGERVYCVAAEEEMTLTGHRADNGYPCTSAPEAIEILIKGGYLADPPPASAFPNVFQLETVEALQDAIRVRYSKWNYFDFCKALALNPKHAHSHEMWGRFRDLVDGLAGFDKHTLVKLLNSNPTQNH